MVRFLVKSGVCDLVRSLDWKGRETVSGVQ